MSGTQGLRDNELKWHFIYEFNSTMDILRSQMSLGVLINQNKY